MTTTADLIQETKRNLLSSHREIYDTLLDPISSTSATTLTISHTTPGVTRGAYLSIELEIMYVWSISGSTVTVERGFLGSTAATHAAGTLVTVNPKFPEFSVLKAINADLYDLSGQGLYRVVPKELTYIAGQMGYDLDVDDMMMGLDVTYDYPGVTEAWPRINNWVITRNVETDSFASGFQLVVHEDAYPGRELRVLVAVPYSPLSALTDDVEAVAGLQPSAHDLPPLGAALKLQGLREGQRNFNDSQPDTRRSDEVRAGDQITSVRAIVDIRNTRIRSEKARLARYYPMRRQVV